MKAVEIGGDANGPAAFYQVAPSQVAVTSRGDIVVLDRLASKVRVFASDGTALASLP